MRNINKFVTVILLFFFISGTFTIAFNSVSASELVEDSWNIKTPMVHARNVASVVAVDDKIYVIGGIYFTEIPYYIAPMNIENPLGINERYDPMTDTWVTLKPMPTPRTIFNIAAYQGKIYCIGNGPTEVYDTATDSWSTKAQLFYDARTSQAHVVTGKIFVRTLCELFMYDTVTDSWAEKTQIPYNLEPRHTIVSAVVDDKILVFQVVESDFSYNHTNEVYVMIYDPRLDIWSEGKTQEIDDAGFIMAAGVTTGVYAPKNVYIFSYTVKSQSMIATMWTYNPLKDAWLTAKVMPTYIYVYGIAEVDDVLYVFGQTEYDEAKKQFDEVNMQYVPIGYDPLGYPTLPTTTAPMTSDDTSFSGSSESKPLLAFLTGPVVTTVVILTCVVIAILFFYLRGKKKQEC
jgi:hypothetical protein